VKTVSYLIMDHERNRQTDRITMSIIPRGALCTIVQHRAIKMY